MDKQQLSHNSNNDPWLTVPQCAERALCHESSIRRMIRAGLVRHARVGAGGKLIRVRASWLDAGMEQCATPSEGR